MARGPRTFVPGAYYHLFSRGSNRQAIFLGDSDRTDFVSCLENALVKHGLMCVAYCLMPNHYHLVLSVPGDRVSRAMKLLNGRYSRRFNQRHDRDAHVFKNRFRAVLLETESHFLWACGYVVMNPVRANLCPRPEEWRWSSYRASVGLEPAPRFLDARRLLSYFGDKPSEALTRYDEFVKSCSPLAPNHTVSDPSSQPSSRPE